MKGLVLKSTGSWYVVRKEDGGLLRARLRGKFKTKGLKLSNPVAVGDHVTLELEGEEGTAVITEIAPRTNHIIRKSIHKTAHAHIIASNIDLAFLVVTLVSPRTSFGFIDRFLVTAEAYHIPVTLLFNKIDLYDEDTLQYQERVRQMYRQIGYESVACSAAEGIGIEEIQQLLDQKVTLFSGHSGVGKSTLVNTLVPDLDLKTTEISAYSDKGVHTTTFAEMFEIGENTFLIDTPGIKELGVVDIPKPELSHYFPEMRDLLQSCRFNNCLHLNEPGCAVREAVDAGKISLTRYDSYRSILEDEDNRR
ncbi:ribosome small subunit-dependent GTPase A [Adhaeribacter soli]|uniref:Small ribosomal subunit biogenesis GTPase RsgA n=1 Tax=Adhaeribacter soli TaxID=2607655 RepID=A0A5N1J240_9BACT|nr:ribosome small subunit-dependent GTPase A [Adhaeribacter soli]KAA9340649.1 ribosome small subunit-dependent GTPase A [Adhaeribacter soli]